MTEHQNPVIANQWRGLRSYTDARIGLGRAGVGLPTSELLAFQLAHAQARDAVHLPLDTAALIQGLETAVQDHLSAAPLVLQSCAADRLTYLQRPDLGRQLSQHSQAILQSVPTRASVDLAIVIVDGLSSVGVQNSAAPLVGQLLDMLDRDDRAWRLAPVTVVQQGRVAIGDEIGERLQARMVAVLIGERPGLSSPDSMGIYLTYDPKPGVNDAGRNCLSNIRAAGMAVEDACHRLLYLMREANRLRVTGVGLKDRTEETELAAGRANKNFLTR
ncbi:ethanolamine ammonia-lyase subunit EutC [Marinobacter salinisoli]|uniref:Ethanolamine ammonia-lyase small subunit n=1 Tax=Marinobacter salinisoli TaxID=2769486 RepID=A0ABX7MTT3_9GAMM|nr:ethanolamine ammonia-lyase subunit EutC [Marinobacter salinisoli]QSP95800.1 ethanolamine ammonia-lyase subunit EutC [Marinobacter salinisoli]